jgi:L-lysine 6-transaminase
MCAFDLPSKEKRDRFIQKAREKGLLILACGDNSIRFRPHLIVTKQEIDLGIDIIEQLVAN